MVEAINFLTSMQHCMDHLGVCHVLPSEKSDILY